MRRFHEYLDMLLEVTLARLSSQKGRERHFLGRSLSANS